MLIERFGRLALRIDNKRERGYMLASLQTALDDTSNENPTQTTFMMCRMYC